MKILETADKAQYDKHRTAVLFNISEEIEQAVKDIIRKRANKPCNLDSTVQACIDAANGFGHFELADELTADLQTELIFNLIDNQ